MAKGRLSPERERALINKVQKNRDTAAFQELYDHYFPKLFAYVGYRIGRKQDIEDLVADTFLRTIEGIDHFNWRGKGSFAAWLFTIARNLISNYYKQRRSEDDALPLEDIPQLEASTLLPLDAVLQKQRLAQMRRLINSLSPRQQEIVTLKFFGELQNREIAVLLELDERTVASHLCRGLRELHHKYMAESVRTAERDSR
jgi:RNA polymerase sigma-70 factor, ECF subfamily